MWIFFSDFHNSLKYGKFEKTRISTAFYRICKEEAKAFHIIHIIHKTDCG
jgi:hypothetical protein